MKVTPILLSVVLSLGTAYAYEPSTQPDDIQAVETNFLNDFTTVSVKNFSQSTFEQLKGKYKGEISYRNNNMSHPLFLEATGHLTGSGFNGNLFITVLNKDGDVISLSKSKGAIESIMIHKEDPFLILIEDGDEKNKGFYKIDISSDLERLSGSYYERNSGVMTRVGSFTLVKDHL